MGDEANKADCELIFKSIDKNGDGKISLDEFSDAVKASGTSSNVDVPSKMKEIDKDGDGFISIDELWEFFSAHPQMLKEAVSKVA
ncbi:hypothetical protein TanjilG_25362 [Lupinus angustifolius]|uniref:EF-hand domain-containing protein n=1 Tax=Lupinus angustifolius TaxID=3871 RepID=A0A4P1RVV8_LUPAN|nr:hypothetical protein TanjilG_25362 [Lupinus angustifolius]